MNTTRPFITLSQLEVRETIQTLTEVVKVNSGLFGNESVKDAANEKIKELIKVIQ